MYAALESDPPSLNPPDYGWKADDVNKTLYPTAVAEGVCMAPDCILKLIRCGCDSETPCIIIGLFNIAAKGWIEQYAISRM